jgi:hypothetical protein
MSADTKPKTHRECVAAGLCDEDDFRGLIPESYRCVDCGYDTEPGVLNREETEEEVARLRRKGIKNWSIRQRLTNKDERYFVHDHVWKKAGMACVWGDGALCIGCLERRIQRKLIPDDFVPDHPFNRPDLPGTRRRFERLTGCETVEGLDNEPPPPPLPASKLELALNRALGEFIKSPTTRWSPPGRP